VKEKKNREKRKLHREEKIKQKLKAEKDLKFLE